MNLSRASSVLSYSPKPSDLLRLWNQVHHSGIILTIATTFVSTVLLKVFLSHVLDITFGFAVRTSPELGAF